MEENLKSIQMKKGVVLIDRYKTKNVIQRPFEEPKLLFDGLMQEYFG